MTDTMALEIAIVKSGMTKKSIASKIGISEMSLSRKQNNQTEFKASEIAQLKKILGLSDEERDSIFFATDVD